MKPLVPPHWRQRYRRWRLSRLSSSEHLALTQARVYVLPTQAGWMLGLTLLLLLAGSINFQLNLGYLLTFMLGGVAVVALWMTQRNLHGLTLSVQAPEGVFATQASTVRLRLHNPTRRPRYAIGLAWFDPEPLTTHTPCWSDVPAQSACVVELVVTFAQRGLHPLPALQIDTCFPLGTSRAWHHWQPAGQCVVYPQPEAAAPALPSHSVQTGPPAHPVAAPAYHPTQEADGVRPYRRGDPLKWVLWKKVARTANNPSPAWVSRDPAATAAHAPLWLDAAATGLSDPEARLSRLCAWVLEADSLGIPYGLRLPHTRIAPHCGPAHLRQCLEALAWA